MMLFISSCSVAIVVVVLSYTFFRWCSKRDPYKAIVATMLGVIAGLVGLVSPKVPPLVALLALLPIMLSLMGFIAYKWWKGGSRIKELLLYMLTELILTLEASAAAVRIIDLTSIRWVIEIFRALPWLAFIVVGVYAIIDMIFFNEYLDSDEFDPKADYLKEGTPLGKILISD